MSINTLAIEQKLITLLAYHEKLVDQNRNKKRIEFLARHIRRLLEILEKGMAA